jgi:hypothetical protein
MDISKLGIIAPSLPDSPDVPDPDWTGVELPNLGLLLAKVCSPAVLPMLPSGFSDLGITLHGLPIEFKPRLKVIDLVAFRMTINGWSLGNLTFPELDVDLSVESPTTPDFLMHGHIAGRVELQGVGFDVKLQLKKPSAGTKMPGWVLTIDNMPKGELVDLKAILDNVLPEGATLPDDLPEVKVGEVELVYELKTPKLSLSCTSEAGVAFGELGKLDGEAFAVTMEKVDGAWTVDVSIDGNLKLAEFLDLSGTLSIKKLPDGASSFGFLPSTEGALIKLPLGFADGGLPTVGARMIQLDLKKEGTAWQFDLQAALVAGSLDLPLKLHCAGADKATLALLKPEDEPEFTVDLGTWAGS